MSQHHTGFSPVARVAFPRRGRRSIFWLSYICINHLPPSCPLCWWLPFGCCSFWCLCNHILEFPECHSTWRSHPASVWTVMRFPFQPHTDLLSFILLSVPPTAFISLYARFIQLCSPVLCRLSVTGGCHNPIGIHLIFPSALFTEQTCTFGISAMEILKPSLILPKMETSVALQKNSTFSCNLHLIAMCWILMICPVCCVLKSFMMMLVEQNWYMWNNLKIAKHSKLSVLPLGAKMCGTKMPPLTLVDVDSH